MKVVFTKRAYNALLTEVAEKISTETGGLFLGHRVGDVWYVIETIDPGPNSVFQVAYFEYDQKYTTFLANKIARLYSKPLKLIGLWHRHPGSFDQFSSTDDGTNKKFAKLNDGQTISALVNIDPTFRLTIYHVSDPIAYKKICYVVDDDAIPFELKKMSDEQNLIDYIENYRERAEIISVKKVTLEEIFNCSINELESIDLIKEDKESYGDFDDQKLDAVLNILDEDIRFLSESCGDVVMSVKGNSIICKEKNSGFFFEIIVGNEEKDFVLHAEDKFYKYYPSAIKKSFEKAEQKRLFRPRTDIRSSITWKILNLRKK